MSTHTTKFEIQKRYCVLFKTGFTVAKHKDTFNQLYVYKNKQTIRIADDITGTKLFTNVLFVFV